MTHIQTTEIMNQMINNTKQQLAQRNLHWTKVGWDDCTRGANSCIGPNISDWSFTLKNGDLLPFIRSPNYTDKTLTIPAKDVSIIVGNERVDGHLKAVTFQDYLQNYGKYTPGVDDEVNLSSGEDELVTIRYIAVIIPEDRNGTGELVPTSYNYQTTSKKDPKNIIGASFHMGVGSRPDGPRCEKVYLVKTQEDGSQDNTWFRITNENSETEEQKQSVATVLGTRSSNIARNRVQCFQIPRLQEQSMRSGLVSKGISKQYQEEAVYRSCSIGNVSYGTSEGKHILDKDLTYRRDTSQNVTITYAYYFTTSDGQLTRDDISQIADLLENSYQDVKATWIGSLVTGEAVGDVKTSSTQAPITLPESSQDDYLTVNQKVTQFPKDTKDVVYFPEPGQEYSPGDQVAF